MLSSVRGYLKRWNILLGAKTPFYFVKNKNAGFNEACVLYSKNFGKYYVISKIFRNENTEKEELHHEAPLLLIVRINILISKKVVKKVVIQLIFIAM